MSLQNRFIKSGIKSFVLILLVLAAAMFPRVITAVGAPAVINFFHFVLILVLTGLILPKPLNRTAKEILFGLLVLMGCILLSAYVNSAGFGNIILDFLLLAEPFMLLIAIIGIPMSKSSVDKFESGLILFALIHIFFSYFQFFVMGLRDDAVKGVFLNMGAGHHVGGAVALTTAVYFFFTSKIRSIWMRVVLTLACTYQVIMCDAKQVIAVFIAALVVLLFSKIKEVAKLLQYLAIAFLTMGIIFWAAATIFPALSLFLDADRRNQGFSAKFSVFSIILSYYHSPLNWLFGLGPGHTIGRLGWLIPDYLQYLQKLDITHSPVFDAVFKVQEHNYFSNSLTGSSLYSLLFSWAGVWGDLGFLGLGTYLYLWSLVWFQLCIGDLSRFFLSTIFVFGMVFSWMEEPGYMLFVISLIGLQWHKHQRNTDNISAKSFRKRYLL